MKFIEFLEMYDNWNDQMIVNDDDLTPVAEDNVNRIYQRRKDLWNKKVLAFGVYENKIYVRVK